MQPRIVQKYPNSPTATWHHMAPTWHLVFGRVSLVCMSCFLFLFWWIESTRRPQGQHRQTSCSLNLDAGPSSGFASVAKHLKYNLHPVHCHNYWFAVDGPLVLQCHVNSTQNIRRLAFVEESCLSMFSWLVSSFIGNSNNIDSSTWST